jgi:hypothetical protein
MVQVGRRIRDQRVVREGSGRIIVLAGAMGPVEREGLHTVHARYGLQDQRVGVW